MGKKMRTNSVALARAAIASGAGQMYDGRRDTWKILGYKKVLTFNDFLALYIRGDVAGRIVDMPCQETWRDSPIFVPKKQDSAGDFVDKLGAFAEKTNLWHWMERVDRVSGIGRFGLLFMGVADQGDLSQPVGGGRSLEDVIYFQSYHQGNAEIVEWDRETTSPRFGYPTMYRLKMGEFITEIPGRDGGTSIKGTQGRRRGTKTEPVEALVHWSRVMHIAEDTLLDNVHGRPRLERMFNRLADLLKIAGGSAEMFWQNVAQIFHLNLDPELQYDPDDLKDLNDKFMEMLEGLRRVIQTEGIEKINTLQGGTPDPRGVFFVLKSLIGAAAEIPQRILFGSEQGEMSSTQDQAEWYGRIASRRTRYANPSIIRPFITRMAEWGALTLPEGGYDIKWPSLFQESPQEKANRGRSMAIAAQAFDKEVPDRLFTASEIRAASGLPPEHPDMALVEKRQAEVQASKDKALAAKIPPPGAPPAGPPKP